MKLRNGLKVKKMILNVKKTKAMIFNFSQNYQFTTNLKLQDDKLEIVKETKLLRVIITDDLKWDRNTESCQKSLYENGNFEENCEIYK